MGAYKRIFKSHPEMAHSFDLLMDLHPLIVETKQFAFGADTFRTSFDWHLTNFAGPDDYPPNMAIRMTVENIAVTADLCYSIDDLEGVVQVVHQGQRWLQGRSSEKHWDQFEDDREYHPPDLHKDEEDEMEGLEGFLLDPSLRHRLALARLTLGQHEEALVRYQKIIQS